MKVSEVIALARKYVEVGIMVSSARLCLADAEKAYSAGNFDIARQRAIKSLAYSVGILHPDYKRASK